MATRQMNWTGTVIFASALAVCASACGVQSGVGLPPRVEPEIEAHGLSKSAQQAFSKAVERWSRRAEIYDAIEARVFWAATLLSPDFRSALDEREAAIGSDVSHDIPISTDCTPSVFVGAFFHEPKLDDLAHRQSIWTLRLTSPSGTYAPAAIRRIARPDRRLRSSFPFLDRFWVGYAVTFAPMTAANLPPAEPVPPVSDEDEASNAPPNETGESAESQNAPPAPSCAAFDWEHASLSIKSVAGAAIMNFSAPAK